VRSPLSRKSPRSPSSSVEAVARIPTEDSAVTRPSPPPFPMSHHLPGSGLGAEAALGLEAILWPLAAAPTMHWGKPPPTAALRVPSPTHAAALGSGPSAFSSVTAKLEVGTEASADPPARGQPPRPRGSPAACCTAAIRTSAVSSLVLSWCLMKCAGRLFVTWECEVVICSLKKPLCNTSKLMCSILLVFWHSALKYLV
jgi:hypothetical protein